MPHKNFPTLLVVSSCVVATVIVLILFMILFLCLRQSKKHRADDAKTMEKQCKESDRSSKLSDLKLNSRTGSSVSRVHCGMDYNPDNCRCCTEQTEHNFPPKSDGYVPYVNYARDYNPLPMLQSTVESSREGIHEWTRLPLNDINDRHRSPSKNLPNRNRIGGVNARFSGTYRNPYLRNSHVGLPAPHAAIPATSVYTRNIWNSRANYIPTSMSLATVLVDSANGAVPPVAKLPHSPTNTNLATIKRGTLV